MNAFRMRGVGRALRAFAAGTLLISAAGAGAQEALYPPGAVVQALPDRDTGAELRGYLTALGDNPRSASALVGAGRAALQMGDAQAALSFFGRADEVAPRDARVKAGMAAALARMGQGEAALGLFAEAVALGAPEVEIAGDRGLARDLVGDPRGAQQDYAMVLQRADDPEVRRRLALSLAISGAREPALAAIEAQLRAQDRAAWRTRALILGLTGDAEGAAETARATMPPHAAQAIAPFLARLAVLNPAQKAMAVHFGQFPSDGMPAPLARTADTSAYPGALALAGAGSRSRPADGLRPRTATPEAVSRAPRRRPGTREEGRERLRSSTSFAPRPTRGNTARAAAEPARPTVQTPPTAQPGQQSARSTAEPQAAIPSQAAVERQQAPVPAPPPPATTAVTAQKEAVAAAPEPGFERIAAVVAALPAERDPPPAAPAAAPPAAGVQPAATSSRAGQGRAERQRSSPPAHPSRHWVQIAGGADKSGLPREFARLAKLAPELLNGRSAWTTPLRFTNRLLVGPFDSAGEAQAFVNLLAVKDVAAFAWTSPAGQEIEPLPVGR